MDIDEFLDQETKVELSKLTKEEIKADKAITDKIQAIRENIHNKRLHEAEKGYLEVREMYYDFVKEMEKARALVKEELLSLHKELIENLGFMKNELLRRIKVIHSLLAKANAHIEQGNSQTANELYLQIKALFANLPDIHSEEKMELEKEIITLYSRLLNLKSRKTQAEFKAVQNRISELIQQCEISIQNNDLENAKKTYNEINKLYSQLPSGFLYEKSLLHRHILELHDHFISIMKDLGRKNAK